MVINTLSGRATQETMKLLAPFGRFIEIGKRDIMEGGMTPMKNFLNNGTYHVFDMDRGMKARNTFIEQTHELKRAADAEGEVYSNGLQERIHDADSMAGRMSKLMREVIDKGWTVPTTVYDAKDVAKAYQTMLKGGHIGKLCVRLPPAQPKTPEQLHSACPPEEDAALVVYKNPLAPPDIFRTDETYIIVGGTSGLGLEIAWTLALHFEGACNICLISRNGGHSSAELKRKLELLKIYVPHKNVEAFAVDITDEQVLMGLLGRIRRGEMGPFPSNIGGVIHSAMVLADHVIRDMSDADMVKVGGTDGTYKMPSSSLTMLQIGQFLGNCIL